MMLMPSALAGSLFGTAYLYAVDKLYDRLKIILICSVSLLELAEKGALTICAVLF